MSKIRIIRRHGARNITGRLYPDGTIRFTIPALMPSEEALPIIEDMSRDLMNRARQEWTPRYLPGMEIPCGESIIRIISDSKRPDYVEAFRSSSDNSWTIVIGSALTPGKKETDLAVNNLLLQIAYAEATPGLIYKALELSQRVDRQPTFWDIGRGLKTLGNCHSDGRITLSCIILFLPEHLQDYIIYHELAHLYEMNHSARFHDICNRYCGGREALLQSELKSFAWPIIR